MTIIQSTTTLGPIRMRQYTVRSWRTFRFMQAVRRGQALPGVYSDGVFVIRHEGRRWLLSLAGHGPPYSKHSTMRAAITSLFEAD